MVSTNFDIFCYYCVYTRNKTRLGQCGLFAVPDLSSTII